MSTHPGNPWTATEAFYDGRRRADKNALSHLHIMDQHFAPTVRGGLPSAAEIQRYIDRLVSEGFSPSTIQTRLSVLKRVFKFGNQAWPERLDIPVRSKRPKWVMPDDADFEFKFWLAMSGLWPDATLLLRFCLETGLRIEEAMRLTPNMVIEATLGGSHQLDVPGTKTDGSAAIIPLSMTAYTLIMPRLLTMGSNRHHLIFRTNYDSILAAWNKACETLGIEDPTATPKAMRRTFAWRLLVAGTPVDVIQTLLRHASLATTSEYLNAVGKVERAAEYLGATKETLTTDDPELIAIIKAHMARKAC